MDKLFELVKNLDWRYDKNAYKQRNKRKSPLELAQIILKDTEYTRIGTLANDLEDLAEQWDMLVEEEIADRKDSQAGWRDLALSIRDDNFSKADAKILKEFTKLKG